MDLWSYLIGTQSAVTTRFFHWPCVFFKLFNPNCHPVDEDYYVELFVYS